MLKRVFITVLAAPLFAFGSGSDDPVVAEVEGEDVHLSRLEQHAMVLGTELDESNYEAILGQMVEARLVANKSKSLNLEDTDSFKVLQGYTYEQQLLRVYLEYLQENVDTDELQEAYQEWFTDNPDYDEVDLQRISLDSRGAAEEVIFMLREGEPFEELASRFSQDTLASQGGSLGWVARGNLPPEVAEVVFALNEGEFVSTPMPAGGRWFVFRVLGRGRSDIPSYESVERGLRAALAARKMQREASALKLERSIKVYNMDGTSMD